MGISTFLTSLTTVRDFFSRAFFIGAILPALLFTFTNAIILFLWSRPVHNWIVEQLSGPVRIYGAVLFVIFFLLIWIYSYVISALTPLWIRTLEGKNWWRGLRDRGRKFHAASYREISENINAAFQIYDQIKGNRDEWKAIISARANTQVPCLNPSLSTPEKIATLKKKQSTSQLIKFEDLNTLMATYENDIRANGAFPDLDDLASEIIQLIDYSYNRALAEHSRLLNERNMEFGDQEDIAPTRFGNVGLSAQAYAMRAFNCNITLIWSALRRTIEKGENGIKELESCKSQLDFFVACYWLSLLLAVVWGIVFSMYGEWVGAILASALGPLLCWVLWYGAAVEQYRVLQELIVSSLNTARFQVLSDLRFNLPPDLLGERELWRAIHFSIGNGQNFNLNYLHPKSTL